MYFDSLRFNKPGTIPLETQTEIKDGCPLDCGLCPEHKQHACLGIIEVNTNCKFDCPICFADSGHQPDGFSLTTEQVEAGLDAFVRSEGEPEVVMFSGGEPTIHPQILDFMRMADDKGVKIVNLNTNGIRLAHDRKFMADLAGLPKKPNIYMQFDGFAERTHTEIRGRDLRKAKEKALGHCAEFGLQPHDRGPGRSGRQPGTAAVDDPGLGGRDRGYFGHAPVPAARPHRARLPDRLDRDSRDRRHRGRGGVRDRPVAPRSHSFASTPPVTHPLLLLEHGEDVARRVGEPRDRRAALAALDPLLVLLEAVVPL
jgi:hypothetical protein